MGSRPSQHIVDILRKVLRELEEVHDPNAAALVFLKSAILRRIAEIEIADAAGGIESAGRQYSVVVQFEFIRADERLEHRVDFAHGRETRIAS
jgi:hypothetical protein